MARYDQRSRPRPALPRTLAVRALNDLLRRYGIGGTIVVSPSVAALPSEDVAAISWAISKLGSFDAELDPIGEHRCGHFEIRDHRVIFAIDGGLDQLARLEANEPGGRTLMIMLEAEFPARQYIRDARHRPFAT